MVKSCTPQFVAFEKKFLTTEAFSFLKMTSFYFFKWLVCMCLFLKSKEEIIGLEWPCPAWEQGNTQKKNNYQSHNFFTTA